MKTYDIIPIGINFTYIRDAIMPDRDMGFAYQTLLWKAGMLRFTGWEFEVIKEIPHKKLMKLLGVTA